MTKLTEARGKNWHDFKQNNYYPEHTNTFMHYDNQSQKEMFLTFYMP